MLFILLISLINCYVPTKKQKEMDTFIVKLLENEDILFSEALLTADVVVESVLAFFDYKVEESKIKLYTKQGKPFSGILIINYSNGDPFFHCAYKEGKQEGVETRYYPNKIVAKKTQFVNNKENGEIYQYDSSGRLNLHYHQKNGFFNGKIKYYYPNGHVEKEGIQFMDETEGVWPNTQKIGIWKYYYENGNLKEEGMWSNTEGGSAKVGEWKYYNEQGELIATENYIYE